MATADTEVSRILCTVLCYAAACVMDQNIKNFLEAKTFMQSLWFSILTLERAINIYQPRSATTFFVLPMYSSTRECTKSRLIQIHVLMYSVHRRWCFFVIQVAPTRHFNTRVLATSCVHLLMYTRVHNLVKGTIFLSRVWHLLKPQKWLMT